MPGVPRQKGPGERPEEEAIKEAIAVVKTVRKGAAGKMDQYASTLLSDIATTLDTAEKAEGCQLT